MQSLTLHFEGVIRIDGGLTRCVYVRDLCSYSLELKFEGCGQCIAEKERAFIRDARSACHPTRSMADERATTDLRGGEGGGLR